MDARLVVGVSGASGAPLALRLLLLAQECGLGVELIVTPGGARTLREECGLGPEDLAQYAEAVYDCADLAAPLSAVHLRNMYELARFGAVVFPPVPAWYAKPQSLEEAERQIAARILAQFGVEAPGAPCWG